MSFSTSQIPEISFLLELSLYFQASYPHHRTACHLLELSTYLISYSLVNSLTLGRPSLCQNPSQAYRSSLGPHLNVPYVAPNCHFPSHLYLATSRAWIAPTIILYFSLMPIPLKYSMRSLCTGNVVVMMADAPTISGLCFFAASAKADTGASLPRSITLKPAAVSIVATIVFPMSCMSPATVPITTVPWHFNFLLRLWKLWL